MDNTSRTIDFITMEVRRVKLFASRRHASGLRALNNGNEIQCRLRRQSYAAAARTTA